jgi:hypothetical protein
MLPFRKIVYILASLLFAACSAIPAQAPEASTQSDAPTPKQPAAKPGTLAASIPVAIWESASEGHLLVPIDPANGQALADYEPISIDPTSGKALTDYKPISLGQNLTCFLS